MTRSNSAKHTPGPWTTETDSCMVRNAQKVAVAFTSNLQNADANARLIAAAPDLLAALKGLLEGTAPGWVAGWVGAEEGGAAGNAGAVGADRAYTGDAERA